MEPLFLDSYYGKPCRNKENTCWLGLIQDPNSPTGSRELKTLLSHSTNCPDCNLSVPVCVEVVLWLSPIYLYLASTGAQFVTLYISVHLSVQHKLI